MEQEFRSNADQLLIAKLTRAAENAIAYFNMKAQRETLGLTPKDDQIRQDLCNAVSMAREEIICGNLKRTYEQESAIKYIQSLKQK